MAHTAQQQFFERLRNQFPEYFSDVRVLEIGSLDINGNLRHLFGSPVWYTGLDLAPGPNVDVVAPGHLYSSGFQYDVVISAESLEHDLYYHRTLKNMVHLLRPGGLIAISCATTGRAEHGTRRSQPADAPFLAEMSEEWGDYYRNITEGDLRGTIDLERIFERYEISICEEQHDLYFWGIKRN